jgi:hypothetical protein
MSALTVTLGADITLRRTIARATELVRASASRMSKMTDSGLAGLGKGRSFQEFFRAVRFCAVFRTVPKAR